MKVYYDDGETEVRFASGDIHLVVFDSGDVVSCTLAPHQARAIAAALVEVAEDRERMLDENR